MNQLNKDLRLQIYQAKYYFQLIQYFFISQMLFNWHYYLPVVLKDNWAISVHYINFSRRINIENLINKQLEYIIKLFSIYRRFFYYFFMKKQNSNSVDSHGSFINNNFISAFKIIKKCLSCCYNLIAEKKRKKETSNHQIFYLINLS
ncbi:unnamed protein product [Paramecium pentaurelia]|uniref:Uncharacterized protein n=1 Tax=Paramecium pentaurelia TaxID=43138 RepID=A0A8S1YNY1_9CILI|nr:unnamed protein product [Paramecium pentaurelia]